MDDRLSTKITSALIQYLEREGGDVEELLSSLDYSREYLSSNNRWITNEDLILLFAAARQMLQDEMTPYLTGRILAQSKEAGFMNELTGSAKTVNRVLSKLPESIQKIYPAIKVELEKENHCEIKVHVSPKGDYLHTRDHCYLLKGMLEGIITMNGCSIQYSEEQQCMVPIDQAGEIDGCRHRIDEKNRVIEWNPHEANIKKEEVIGNINPDMSYQHKGTLYGAKECIYKIKWKDKRSILKKVWDYSFGYMAKFIRIILALEKYQVEDEESFQEICSEWRYWLNWEASYTLTKAKYMAYLGVLVLAILPVVGNFFDEMENHLFQGFSTIILTGLILTLGFSITKLMLGYTRELHRQKERADQILQRAGVGVTLINPDHQIVYANPLVFKLHGQVMGKKCHEAFCWEQAPCPGCALKRILKDKSRESAEAKFFTRDGEERWFFVTQSPMFDKNNQVMGVLNVSTDITKNKQLEFELAQKQAALEESQAKYRNFMENAADAIMITDLEGNLVEASNQFYRLLEVPEHERTHHQGLLNKVMATLEDTQKINSISRDMIQDKYPRQFELKIQCRSERIIDVEVRAIPLLLEDEVTWLQFIMRDITERKQREMEKNLHLSISNAIKDAPDLAELVEQAVQGISQIMQVPIAAIFLKNPGQPQLNLASQVGLSSDAIKQLTRLAIDGSAANLASRTAILNRPLVISDVREMKMNNQTRERLEMMGVQSIMCMPMLMEEKLQGVIQITSRQEGYFNQERINVLHQVSNELAIGIARQRLRDELRESNEELKRKHQELERTTIQLLQSEKMASIGQLAAGIAHEINNPMGFINSNLNVLDDYRKDLKQMFQEYKGLQDEIGKGNGNEVVSFKLNEIEKIEEQMELENLFEEFEALIKESKEGAERVKNIILNLKEFSHPSKGEPEWADINHGVESTLNIVWNELKYIANVKRDYGDLPQIKCYPQELNQVFMNLLVNAAQAMQERGEINISTWCEDDHVAVQIKDTGMGMTKVQMGKIFDPFYTTKEVGKGTGLGLSISYRIVKKHNGEIKVESEPGKGTTFTVLLPIKGVEPEDKNHPKDIAQA